VAKEYQHKYDEIYKETSSWRTKISIEDPPFYKQVNEQAKRHTMKITGCTEQKFDELEPAFDNFIFELKDLQIISCYFDYLDRVRSYKLQNRNQDMV